MRIIEHICARDGIPFVRRPVDRTEVLSAKEIGIAGTISELTLVEEVDGFAFPTDGVLARLRAAYLRVMRRQDALDGVEMVPLSVVGREAAVRAG